MWFVWVAASSAFDFMKGCSLSTVQSSVVFWANRFVEIPGLHQSGFYPRAARRLVSSDVLRIHSARQ